MSYLKEQHLVQEEHFPALDFKCGDDWHILIYTFSCKFLGGKKPIILGGQMKTDKSSMSLITIKLLLSWVKAEFKEI